MALNDDDDDVEYFVSVGISLFRCKTGCFIYPNLKMAFFWYCLHKMIPTKKQLPCLLHLCFSTAVSGHV